MANVGGFFFRERIIVDSLYMSRKIATSNRKDAINNSLLYIVL